MSRTVSLRVQRYRPEQDDAPVWQQFEVPYDDHTSVLDALNWIKAEQDSSLAYRWSCRMAICGSCGFNIDGEPKLGCNSFIRDYPKGLSVGPMSYFPVEKDLIVDLTKFLEHLSSVKPYLVGPQTQAAHPSSQTPAQLARYKEFAACITCGLCYSACPQFGLNPEFLGPAAITLAQRYNLDSRDQGKGARLPVLNQSRGVWGCTFVGSCSRVCPKGVHPAAAVNQGKLSVVTRAAMDWLRPTRKGGA